MAVRYFAVVPAAGTGARIGGERPKQYQEVAGRPMLEHAVASLLAHEAIAAVFVAIAPGDPYFAECRWSVRPDAVVPLHCGGPTRACTVFNALIAARDRIEGDDWVLVHDAARPCLGRAELDQMLQQVGADEVGGLLALPLSDTLKHGEQQRVAGTVPRDNLWRALTPQMFRYALLVEALHRVGASGPTDESAAIEALGLQPLLVPGAATNIKVTLPEDFELAAAILQRLPDFKCA